MKTTVFGLFCLCLSVGCKPTPAPPVPAPMRTVAPDVATASDAATVTAVAAPDAAAPDAMAESPPPTEPRVTFNAPSGGEGGIVESGIPALSADGATLVTIARGRTPGSTERVGVQLRDAHNGSVRRTLAITSQSDAEALFSQGVTVAIAAGIRGRVTEANTALAGLSARPLVGVEMEPEGEQEAVSTGTGEGWSVRFDGAQLSVRRGAAASAVVLTRRLPPMRGARGCTNAPNVRGFFPVAPDRLLVQVGYRGNDSCWEGPDTWVVLTIPAR